MHVCSMVYLLSAYLSVQAIAVQPGFTCCFRTHYALKRSEVQQQLQDWLLVADKKTIPAMKEATKSIQAELQKLPGL